MGHGAGGRRPAGRGRRFDGLLLDFGGVLTEGVGASIRSWCLGHGLDSAAWGRVLGEHPRGRRLYKQLEVGALPQAEWNAATAPLLGVEDSENLMGRVWARVTLASPMAELAAAARSAGHRVGLLSNSFGLDPYDPYRSIGVWDLFDAHTISEAEGVAKPDPRIYRAAVDRLGVPAGRCVFVDDVAANLKPAADLGMAVVLAGDAAATARRVADLLGVAPAGWGAPGHRIPPG
ncbi:hypothetical protein GCM10027440_06360 [Nocardiopsis coralliicola]